MPGLAALHLVRVTWSSHLLRATFAPLCFLPIAGLAYVLAPKGRKPAGPYYPRRNHRFLPCRHGRVHWVGNEAFDTSDLQPQIVNSRHLSQYYGECYSEKTHSPRHPRVCAGIYAQLKDWGFLIAAAATAVVAMRPGALGAQAATVLLLVSSRTDHLLCSSGL